MTTVLAVLNCAALPQLSPEGAALPQIFSLLIAQADGFQGSVVKDCLCAGAAGLVVLIVVVIHRMFTF